LHGTPTTDAETIRTDLLAFIRSYGVSSISRIPARRAIAVSKGDGTAKSNTQIDADEAEVNRPSNRIVWLCDALAWICVFRVICGSIFLLAATQLAVAVIWLN
jgi:hypothetical protein